MINAFLIAIAAGLMAATLLALLLVVLVCWWIGISARGSWRRSRAVTEETQDEAEIARLREIGYRAFNQHAEQAVAITRAWGDEENQILTHDKEDTRCAP